MDIGTALAAGIILGFGAASAMCLGWRERERRLRRQTLGAATLALTAALAQLESSIERDAFDPGLLREVGVCRDLAATLAGLISAEEPSQPPATSGPAPGSRASDRPNPPSSEGSGSTAYDEARRALNRDLVQAVAALDHGTAAAERLGFLVEDQGDHDLFLRHAGGLACRAQADAE